MTNSGDELGLQQPITRRDFIGGVATGVTLLAASAAGAAASAVGGVNPTGSNVATLSAPAGPGSPGEPYPPLRSGLRGQYPGSFEVAHLVRDGRFDGAIAA